jgi:hypothetical protein
VVESASYSIIRKEGIMSEILKVRVELEIYTKDGNYEVKKVDYYNEEVKDWDESKQMKFPYQCIIEKIGSININSVQIKTSPGHWVLFGGGYIWVP